MSHSTQLADSEIDFSKRPDEAGNPPLDAREIVVEGNVLALTPVLAQVRPTLTTEAAVTSCQMTVLTAVDNATRKSYSLDPDGRLVVVPYANEYRFTQRQVSVSGIGELAELIEQQSGQERTILIRGSSAAPASCVVTRTKLNFPERPEGCPWVMLDLDGIELPEGKSPDEPAAIEYLVSKLPAAFHNVSYFCQFSSSAGILRPDGSPYKPGVSAHIFFWLDRPATGVLLAAWLRIHCIESGFYKKKFNAVDVPRIVYGVDEAVLKSSVQPHYVALPFIGDGVQCVLRDEDRQGLVEKVADSVLLPLLDDNIIALAAAMHRVVDDAWKQENGFRRSSSSTRARDGTVSTSSYYARADRQAAWTGRPFLRAVGRTGCRDGTPYQSVTLYLDGESSPGSWYVHDYDPTTARHHGDGERMHLRELSAGAYEHLRDDLKWIEELVDGELEILEGSKPADAVAETPDELIHVAPAQAGSVVVRSDVRDQVERAMTQWQVLDTAPGIRQISERQLDIVPAEFEVRSSGVFYLRNAKTAASTQSGSGVRFASWR